MTRLHRLARSFLILTGGAALVIMMLHITTEVILRAIFGITLPGTLEFVSFYHMVAAVFAGLALVAVLNEQVIVEIFLGWMPQRPLALVDGVAALLGAAYAGFIAYGAWLEANSATRFGELVPVPVFDVPIWPARWLAFGGLSLVALASLVWAVVRLRRAFGTGGGA